jgi:membrane-bound inhibitor of C-type lysozyme
MRAKRTKLFAIIAATACLSGCDGVRMAPQVINADGQRYLACTGLVWASRDNGLFADDTVFKVSFTDSGGMGHTVWGTAKLSISEPPYDEMAPFHTNAPDTSVSLDAEGRAYVSGRVYTWFDGSKAELVGNKWRPVKVADACNSSSL